MVLRKNPLMAKIRMQHVQFKSLDECLAYLPDDELVITEYLRKMIFDCAPDIKEKLSFNVPYYSKNKGLFFLWPASVLWGSKPSHEGVRFGFQQGNLLTDEDDFLDKGGRTQVYWHDYKTKKEINPEQLKRYIYEAVIIDEEFKKKKKKKK